MIQGAGHQTQFPLISMQNLLETYAKSSNSSHISVESDKQPVSVDVDERYSIWIIHVLGNSLRKLSNHKHKFLNYVVQTYRRDQQAVREMNLSRKEKTVNCYADTGILDVWSPKKHDLYEGAVEKRHSLCPYMIDESGQSNDTDDQQEMRDLSVRQSN